MAQMNNKHRYFIQYMLKNGIVTVDDAHKYCHHVSQGEIDNMTQLKTLVIEVNREISQQFYKIVYNTCEVTNKNYLIWVNTKNDDISKLQIIFSALELEYFHAILQEILQSEEYRITCIVCINITSTLTAFFSRENGQKVLSKWINNGYFINENPHIYLGPRLILEFTSYLKAYSPGAICTLCSELVFRGDVCNSCHKTIHSHCLEKYLKTQNNCPHCLAMWTATRQHDENNMDEDGQISQTALSNSRNIDYISMAAENKRSRAASNIIFQDYNSSEEDPNVPGPSTRKRHR